jgi:hypothetical protein
MMEYLLIFSTGALLGCAATESEDRGKHEGRAFAVSFYTFVLCIGWFAILGIVLSR